MKRRRHTKLKLSEIVRVDSPLFLVNSRQLACRYETADGEPLAPGFYLALWPAGTCPSVYSWELRYLGPFASKAAATMLQTSAKALEIIDLNPDAGHTALVRPPALNHGHQSYPMARQMQVAATAARIYQGA